ncbi:hypothetical protein NFI96_007309, partial [Prochilodus magdalenae]
MTKMASRAHREAQRLTSFCKLVFIYLIISSFFARFTRANFSYSRQALLDINIRYTNIGFDHPFDFNQLPPEMIRTPGPSESLVPTGRARRRRRERKQRRGKRGGLRAKLMLNPHRTVLPSVFLANVRSLAGKLDELKIWTLTQRRHMDCNLMFFTETWLNSDVANSVVELEGRALFRADRSAAATGKTRGGGNCIYVNKAWCTDSVVMVTHCSADLEFLIIKCRPFYLPREFNCVFAGIVYVPPDANANAAMEVLCAAISKLQTDQPNGAFIVAGDFNHSDLRSGLPKFFQNVSCTTRGHRTLDKVYTNVANAYKATPLPHLGQSDHLSLFLLPKYTPVIRRVTPATRSVKIWMEGADSFLQQEFKLTDWSEYAARATTDSHINIDIYTNSVLEHINNCVDRVTSHKTIINFPNQKPWMNREVRLLLKARDAAFRSGDREAYSSARANLRKGISMAKHCYKQRIEEHFSSSDPRRMWQGIQTLTDYKPRSTVLANNSASLPDELNHFYARFDRGNMVVSSKTDPPLHDHPLTLSTLNVRRTLSRTATIVPVPKHPTASALNDFRPVALTPIISKCFERLVLSHLKSCLPATLDPHQFAYRSNRSTEDAISTAPHTALTHLDCQNSYVRMLFIDFSAAFNTVIPSKLISKLNHLGISTTLCNWISDFLTDRPQSVKILVNFYRCTIESILSNGISVWYGNCCAADRKALQRVVKMAQRITGTQLPTIQDIYRKRCLGRARNIIKDVSHPNHGLFTLLPSDRRYRSLRSRTSRLRSRTSRLKNSFFHEA